MYYPQNYQNSQNIQFPAMVFFHGGGWVKGKPKQFYRQCNYYSKKGFVCASAEYRLISKYYNINPQHSVEDAKSAIRFLRENANKLKIDKNKIIAAGGSAGGHLAISTALLAKYDNDDENLTISSIPNAVILFNPIIDTSKNGYGYKKVKYFWKDISPIENIKKNAPPTLILLGSKDRLVPVETAYKFKKLMEKNNSLCDVVIYKGEKHGFFNKKRMYRKTLEDIDTFLHKLGYLVLPEKHSKPQILGTSKAHLQYNINR